MRPMASASPDRSASSCASRSRGMLSGSPTKLRQTPMLLRNWDRSASSPSRSAISRPRVAAAMTASVWPISMSVVDDHR